ncbi:MAG: ABC transporter permease [Mucilaginibacter sp.]|uniref:ABC transporter permease n=1 Tax=Mucilaginibacter sp. TaxID=1882438 RepID=UPI0034E42BEA
MIRNYFKTAIRNLWRNKLYSFINISGLALGLAICMLIMLYVAHEYSFDRFHANAGRIFSVHSKFVMGSDTIQMPKMSFATAPLVKKSDGSVTSSMRIFKQYAAVTVQNPENEDLRFSESNILYADANFFQFFSFRLLSGKNNAVLNQPFQVVISKDIAQKYFGNENPVGKTLNLLGGSTFTFQVTGVMENSPSNTDLGANFVASVSSLNKMPEGAGLMQSQLLQGGGFATYFTLKKPSDAAHVEQTMQTIAKKSSPESSDKYLLTALPDLHLKMNFDDTANLKYIRIFPFVAALVLLLALVNYMSLSTARSTLRAKEVGVRKVTGASRKTIALQFYIESALYAVLSFVLAYILVNLSHNWFFNLLQLKIDTGFIYSPTVNGMMIIFLLATIIGTGSYPAIILSAFKPVATLSGKMSNKTGGVWVRKTFTVLQFVISVALIICGIVIDRQLYYMRHTETGVNRENVLTIPVQKTIGKHYQALKKDIQNLAGVQEVATAHYAMYKGYDEYFTKSNIGLPSFLVDKNFIPTLGIKWKIQPSSEAEMTRPNKVIINEAAIGKLHLQGNPIGQTIDFVNRQSEVIGVVKNFNYQSLEAKIDALALFIAPDTTTLWGQAGNFGSYLLIKTARKTNLPELVTQIKKVYNQYDKETPFEYQFVDETFNAMFKAEDRLANIFSLFIGLTIFIACLGLFGLATFSAEQRTKEIGIRKVLGASVSQITALLSKDFVVLVILAILIASPIAFFTMQKWLQDFAYRIEIKWWMFALAGSLAIVIALLTISFQSVKAALANPVKSLRSE